MTGLKDLDLGEILGNEGVEVCRVEVDGVEVPVRVRAGTLSESAAWCREARAAVGRVAEAQELRELAQRIRGKALEDLDEEGLARAAGLRERAEKKEEEYWDAVCRLAREFLMGGGEGAQTGMSVSQLTAGQVNAVFEVALSLSDPTHAVAGFRGAVVAAVVKMAVAEVREQAGKNTD